jgi:hypothetical protein
MSTNEPATDNFSCPKKDRSGFSAPDHDYDRRSRSSYLCNRVTIRPKASQASDFDPRRVALQLRPRDKHETEVGELGLNWMN